MHFIQEIKFLKAYYWAQLGKFAFTPEDRIAWTNRAAKDLNLLGIPSDTYCNQDPGNFYYTGFQADLRSPSSRYSEERTIPIVNLPNVVSSISDDTNRM